MRVAALFILSCILASPSAAQTPDQPAPIFDEAALVDQYMEDIPTAAGPQPADGSRDGQAIPLPPDLSKELRQAVGAEEAKRLEEVATSPRFGAPAAPLREPDAGALHVDDAPSAFSAAVAAFADEGGGSLLPLILALVIVTAGLFCAAVFRRGERLGT